MNESPDAVVQSLTAAWRSADPERIRHDIPGLYAHDAVIAAAGGERPARGRDAIVDSYLAFARDAKILEAHVEAPVIDRFDRVAVATVNWSMAYEYGGTRSAEVGRDVYVLYCKGETWRIYWRELATRPSDSTV